MTIKDKLQKLPREPGVYFYKDTAGDIIYVGKAINLRNRVRQYFQKSRQRDVKTDLLVKDIADVDWTVVDSEIEALFLEGEMIKRYMPKYNIDLRDDKNHQYVRIDSNADHPVVQIVRRPMDDGADYFGPYMSNVRPALKFLRKIFPFDYKNPHNSDRVSLDYHIGLSPGLEENKTSREEYLQNLRNLKMYLRGERVKVEAGLKRQMEAAAKAKEFEKAATKRNQLRALKGLKKQIIFSKQQQFDVSKDQALNGLSELLNLKGSPRRIEGFDISHMSGTHNVASMVVFTNGVSDKGEYRKFKIRRGGNDDFGHMREVITRRFNAKNIERWPKPDLLLIDGGKGQVSSAQSVLLDNNIDIPLIGLAKRYETIIVPSDDGQSFEEVSLDKNSHILKLLMRIRDESHRFAVSYHSALKRKKQTASLLEDVQGVGPKNRKKLIRRFGSLKAVLEAPKSDLVDAVGPKIAKKIVHHFNNSK